MGKIKNDTLHVKGIEVGIYTEDYRNSDDPRFAIQNWMRNRNTIEFLGLWESLHNPSFNRVQFDTFKTEAGLNRFVMTPSKWIEQTGAIGITSKAGRYKIPELTKEQQSYVYADEADMLNVALFGMTAAQWRLQYPGRKGNIRDYASLQQLLVLANLESYNALLIEQKHPQGERLMTLRQMAVRQLQVLSSLDVSNLPQLPSATTFMEKQ